MDLSSAIPVISLVGRSNSGKTTFIEKLIAILHERGLQVAIAKQHHADVDVDVVGKDSWRYAQAGADCSIISTPAQLSLVYRREEPVSVTQLTRMMADAGFNLLVIESFGDCDEVDRYVVARTERDEDPALSPAETVGVITDDRTLATKWEEAGCLSFDLNDVALFADYLAANYDLDSQ